MSNYQDKLDQLQASAEEATSAALNAPDDLWPDEAVRLRCLNVLAYVGAVLDRTDPLLLTDAAFQAIHSPLAQIRDSPRDFAANSDPWSNNVLDAIVRLPVAQDRGVEQSITSTAATFQRSAAARLSDVQSQYQGLQGQLAELQEQLAEQRVALTEFVEAQSAEVVSRTDAARAEFEAKIANFQAAIDDERAGLQRLRSQQAQTFSDEEQARAEAARDRITKLELDLKDLHLSADARVTEQVAEIERMADESGAVVGAIGLAGTADRFGEEVTAQKAVADIWRLVTIVLALSAVGAAIYAISGDDPDAETFVGKLALSVILGGLAAYTARQSARHRDREERARDLQLQLTAFSPFIEPLSEDQREEERVRMARKTFGGAGVAIPPAESGPGPLSFILQARARSEESTGG